MPDTQRKVRVGFAGVGAMGQCAHLRNYAVLPECEVVAIAELRGKTAQHVAQRYAVPRVYATAEEMLEREDLDAIVASQPFTRHGVLIPGLLEAGKPVFIEKPISSTIESGERVVEAVRKSGTWLMVGYHKRSDPAVMYAKAEVDRLRASGEVGKMRYVRSLMPAGDWIAGGFAELVDGGDPRPALEFEPPPSDMDAELYQHYSSFVNYYIHQVNLLRHFLGEPYTATYADPSGVLFVGTSGSGIPCTIEMSPFRSTLDWKESVLVAFERGYVQVELPAPLASNRPGRVEVFRDPGRESVPETRVPTLPWVHAMRQQARNFIAAVNGTAPPMCTAEEALEDLRVARQYLRLWKGA